MINFTTEDKNRLLTTEQAADVLNMSAAFLVHDRWSAKKKGTDLKVPVCKIGRSVRYRLSDLRKYVESNMIGDVA